MSHNERMTAVYASIGETYITPEERARRRRVSEERREREHRKGEKKLTRREERQLWHDLEELRRAVREFNAKQPKPASLTASLSVTFDHDDMVEYDEWRSEQLEAKKSWRSRT